MCRTCNGKDEYEHVVYSCIWNKLMKGLTMRQPFITMQLYQEITFQNMEAYWTIIQFSVHWCYYRQWLDLGPDETRHCSGHWRTMDNINYQVWITSFMSSHHHNYYILTQAFYHVIVKHNQMILCWLKKCD